MFINSRGDREVFELTGVHQNTPRGFFWGVGELGPGMGVGVKDVVGFKPIIAIVTDRCDHTHRTLWGLLLTS